MLCACSGEQFKFEEIPQSPESLATRDFSAGGLSLRTNDWNSKFDDSDQVDDVESALKETLSLNYEEARALLGRLEYQRGNFDAAVHVFQGINVQSLAPKMTAAIEERTRQKRGRSKGEITAAPVMSMHSVSLLLEATLLKAKSLKELNRPREAAGECGTVVDIVEAALPGGLHHGLFHDCKMQEMFHKALDLQPRLWKQAGLFEDAISSYRKALIRNWNLDSQCLANIQKDLATLLLYGGLEVPLPTEQQVGDTSNPSNSMEEAVLLLLILMRKMAFNEIPWDPEIINHLGFALSVIEQYDILADHIEQLLPGVYNREERWYLLALCYCSMGQNDAAINLLKKGLSSSYQKNGSHFHSLLLGSKLCSQSRKHALEGIDFAQKAMGSPERNLVSHFRDSLHHFIGISYGCCSRSSSSDSERLHFEGECLKSLGNALIINKQDPEIFFSIGLENLVQRNLNTSLENAKKHMEMVGGASMKGWKLLATIMSTQSFPDAEGIVDLGLSECGKRDQLDLLRLKGVLQAAQEQFKLAIDTYRVLLSAIHSQNIERNMHPIYEGLMSKDLGMEAWQDLTSIYTKIGSLEDAKTCLEKAKSLRLYSARTWHLAGKLLETQCLDREAMGAYLASLSIEPDYVSGMVSAAILLMKCSSSLSLTVARSLLMNALQLDPRSHDAWISLGLVSRREGSLQQAADCFQAAYELKQSCPVEGLSDELEYLYSNE